MNPTSPSETTTRELQLVSETTFGPSCARAAAPPAMAPARAPGAAAPPPLAARPRGDVPISIMLKG
jgi:hypothetical protein